MMMITRTQRWTYLAVNMAAIGVFGWLWDGGELYAPGRQLVSLVTLHLPMLFFVRQTLVYYGGLGGIGQLEPLLIAALAANVLYVVWVLIIPFLHTRMKPAAIHLGIAGVTALAIYALNSLLITLRHI